MENQKNKGEIIMLEEMLEYAEKRLDEEIRNGETTDITYWHGYRDAIKAIISEQDKGE